MTVFNNMTLEKRIIFALQIGHPQENMFFFRLSLSIFFQRYVIIKQGQFNSFKLILV